MIYVLLTAALVLTWTIFMCYALCPIRTVLRKRQEKSSS